MFLLIVMLVVLVFLVFLSVILFNSSSKKDKDIIAMNSEVAALKTENFSLNTMLVDSDKRGAKIEEDSKQIVKELREELKLEQEKSSDYRSQVAKLETELREQSKAMQDKLDTLQNSEMRLKVEFENLANKIFQNSSKKLNEENKESLQNVLTPVKEQLRDFKQKVEDVYDKESNARSALQNELKTLKELNQKMTNEAHNLTNALRNSSKHQGVWGEMVLENVLENSGLREGFEYVREYQTTDSEGKRFRPDVVVKLPDDRDIIIDAKTSLVAYNDYMSSSDNEAKKTHLKNHITSIRSHIKTLGQKNYENLEGINSLDFIFMFVPIEGALLLALNNDENLFDEAFKQKIILVSPTTLLVSLRAIENTWRYEKQAKSITDIYFRAEELYKKFVGFIEDLEKVGKSINDANKSYENAFNKLKTGRGNLIGQVEKLKKISNIKPKKEIDNNLIE